MMLTLTLLRVLTLLTAAVSLLVSVIVALPTTAMFNALWLGVALTAGLGYILTTWLFIKTANYRIRKSQPAEIL